MQFSRPLQCSFCNRMFLMPQDLNTHLNLVHLTNHNFPVSTNFPHLAHYVPAFAPVPAPAPAPAPISFSHNPYRNPNLGVPVRNRFEYTYYRRGYLDNLGRFQRGVPPARSMTPARRSNFVFEQEEEEEEKPRPMDLFPATSSSENGDGRTLPLLCQLEQQKIPEDIVMENVEAIDLTLRL